eukprot:4288151-Ditylum_brightwellii.AAC.1
MSTASLPEGVGIFTSWLPIKSECAPTLQYPQGDLDTCEDSLNVSDSLLFLINTLRGKPQTFIPKKVKQTNNTLDILKT